MSLLVVLLLGLFICLAPVYTWLIPMLETGGDLLAMIFVYVFFFGWLGAKKPVVKTVPIMMLVNMAGPANEYRKIFQFAHRV